MKESFEAQMNTENGLSQEEIENGKIGFEKLARRLDRLWQKEDKDLTPEEKAEIDIIFNNAMVMDEMLRGKMPEEFRK